MKRHGEAPLSGAPAFGRTLWQGRARSRLGRCAGPPYGARTSAARLEAGARKLEIRPLLCITRTSEERLGSANRHVGLNSATTQSRLY